MIRIKNIYYMLAYAFQVLNEHGYRSLSCEEFENTGELLAAILARGLCVQVKRGLGRDYIQKTETLSTLHGRINISESIKTQSLRKKQLVCTYDEFSVDFYLNQIIKTTAKLLLCSRISSRRKRELRKYMIFLEEVDTLDIHRINWNIAYNRSNQTYQMLIFVCYLVIKGLLQKQEDGSSRLMDFFDEQRMCRLYEKFILGYYKKEFPSIKAEASQIAWKLDDGMGDFLPIMQSDIMLSKGNDILIIDAKYYSHTTQTRFGAHTLHSGNLYQIFAYVKNKEAELSGKPHRVSGMLLYAKTEEEIQPDNTYSMSGNQISVKTLDLNIDFPEIKKQLNQIAALYFGDMKSQ